MLVCHRLILSRFFRSLLHQELANFVRVADRFLDAETFPATVAILEPWWSPANLATLFDDRLGHHLDGSLWRLPLSSVELSEMLDPSQVPLGPSRYFLRVPKQNCNPIHPGLDEANALRAFVDLGRNELIGA
jgi:hypothetical protein